MNDSKKKTLLLIILMCTSFFIVIMGLIISTSKIDKQTEYTTTLYTATVSDIDITDTGKRIFAEIYTNEYDTSLHISTNICTYINMNDIRDLKNGQTIFFKIENINTEQMNKVEFVNIVSLKTDTNDIFSLNDYNEYMHVSAYPTRIVSILISALLLLIILFCVWKIRTVNTKGRDSQCAYFKKS